MAKTYTIRETARLTGYSVRNVRCLIHKGVIPAKKNTSGHWWFIDEDQIQILCDRRAKNENRGAKHPAGVEGTAAVGVLSGRLDELESEDDGT